MNTGGRENLLKSRKSSTSSATVSFAEKSHASTKQQEEAYLPRINQKKVFKVDNPDVAKFLHGRLKVPKTLPLPVLGKYDHDPFADNPLLKFKLSAGKTKRVYEFFEGQAVRNKIKTYRTRLKEPEVAPIFKTTEECKELLRKFGEAQPTVPIQETWILSIEEKLHSLHLKFPQIAASIFDEVRESFMKEMHEFGVSLVTKTEKKKAVEGPTTTGGKTAWFPTFQKRRETIKKNLFLFHPLQRKIFVSAITTLPEILTDFRRYRSLGVLELDNWAELVQTDIKKAEHLVSTSYYSQISSALQRKNWIRDIPLRLRKRFFHSATNILQIQVTSLMYRSINHLLWLTEDARRMPYLALNLVCDKDLSLYPSDTDIYETYHGILETLATISSNLPPLETWLDDIAVPPGNVKITIDGPFLEEAHNRLQKNLQAAFEDIDKYIEELKTEHGPLYTDALINQLSQYFAEGPSFDELFEKRLSFQKYVNNLGNFVEYEYFKTGQICQNELIGSLRELAENFCDALHGELLRIHGDENVSICDAYEELKHKALKEPECTEELMELGIYMLTATASIITDLQNRIKEQLINMARLFEIADVPVFYTNLMAATVAWVQAIRPVFDLNSAQYEQRKFEFEERLQKRNEKLYKDLEDLGPKLVVLNSMDDTLRIAEYIEEIKKFLSILESMDKDVEWINYEESLFKFPLSTFPELDELHNFINPFAKLLFMAHKWQWKHRVWMHGSFQELEADAVENTTEQYYKDCMDTQKTYKAKIKQQISENAARRFKGNVDDPDPNNIPVPLKITGKTLEQIKEFKQNVPLVRILCNKALKQRHWDEMSELCGFDITPDYGTTLSKVVKLNLTPYLDQFELISVGAIKEMQLGENLPLMRNEWKDMKFTLSTWKETGLSILTELDDIQALLDDHLVKTLTMRGSAFVKPFETEVKSWYNLLDRVNKTIEAWGKVQVQWLYLLPIFSSKDIASQMQEEATMFKDIDATFRKTMEATWKDPRVLETAGAPGLYETFSKQLETMEKINDGVNNYLEKKRLFFPRFFFLSNDEMLEILSETKDPLRVQPHLRKCFEGIAKLEFDKDLVIHAMISSEGECVPFVGRVSTKEAGGSVEKWLLQVEHQMLASVRESIRNAHVAYPTLPRTKWIQHWPGQVVLCVSQMYWTADVHHELRRNMAGSLLEFHDTLKDQLNETVALVRGELTKMTRLTLGALIVIDVHAKDTVEQLTQQKLKSDAEFGWLAQLRYYWEENDCLVRMVNATINYAYEYLGNTPRLVITPLTDRCYRTLIGAYCLHLNGAPEGPAGTGKTETTKDLAKALAVQCIVFNCSDGLDYIAMGKFFKGLASSGAWACFDEFNRIELEVLSVIAQQILCIMRAVQAGVEKFMFEGTELVLNPKCYVCITMNPGYAGRSELPDNLKVLFRTVAMMVPDYALIGEISLYSYGFDEARALSIKIVTTYRLCSEQLSVQSHYDYGMRAVKTVLTAAGALKLAFPDTNEHVLLLRAIVDVNRSKLLDQDVPLFEGIIQDMFPGVIPMIPDYSSMTNAMERVCAQRNLQCTEYFRKKVVETYEMMNVRHGFMLVGEPYGGKTSVLKVLAEVLEFPTEYVVINPKSITMDQLYGQFDPISYEWSDGILSIMFRKFSRDLSEGFKWLVLDGPVDAVWIENMNTVLDDNKKLCLNSGEVMVMSEEMRLIFEVLDLRQASPATVSRCGMIYLEPRALGWEVLVKSWMAVQDPIWMEEIKDLIWDLLTWVIPPSLNFIRKNCRLLAPIGDSGKVVCMLQLIRMLMTNACKTEPLFVPVWLQSSMIYAGLWGLGGTIWQGHRSLFNDFFMDLWRGNDEGNPIPESLGKLDITLPMEGNMYDFCYSFKGKGNWKNCVDILKLEKTEEPGNLAQMLVPTTDTVKYSTLLDLHIEHNVPLLLVGGTGTGKSVLVQNMLLTKIEQEKYLPAFVTFTASTSANETQKLVISKLVKRRRGIFGPPKGQQCVLFIDDVNMPAKEVYGAQPAVELLRQFLDSGQWFDFKDGSTIKLVDVLFLSAMGLPGGSRQEVSARFLRHFNVFGVNDASEDSMTRIFTAILLTALKRNGFASDVITSVSSIVNATMDVYQSALAELRPTPTKSHYVFNLRDFSRVVQGCGLIHKDSVDSRKVLARLWVHETLRVFYDRLIDDVDRAWMFEKLKTCVKDHMKENFDQIFDHLKGDSEVCEESLRDLMFGNYLDVDSLEDERKYEELSNVDQLLDMASSCVTDYNATHNTKIDIVLFRYALEHLNRLCRLLALPGGCGLLVGVSGSGRTSLTRLATAMMSYLFFQPEVSSNYSFSDWRNDLKKVLREAGGRGKSTTFLFSQDQIKDEAFLYDIDALLNLGEVPELFAIDEKQEVLEMVRLAAQGGNRNLDISPLQVFNFFVARCKQKLHMMLCFSPGSSFRNRLRLYSSLVNCCTIDWFFDWPVDALEMVAAKIMTDVNLPDVVKTAAVAAGKCYHTSAKALSEEFYRQTQRKTYVTSASFCELITSFAKLTNRAQSETLAAKMRYIGGLDKLEFASTQVTAMSKELSELKPKLEVAKSEAIQMMTVIDSERRKVESAAALVREDEKVANEQAAASLALKAECEADLAQAIPILEEAIAALNTLKPADITLVKSMKNPPDAIKLVMAAVCVMKDVKPDRIPDPGTGRMMLDYWGPSKRILGDIAFLQTLKDYDKDNIGVEIMTKIRKEFIPHKDFKPNIVAKASSAAEGLCKWVIAMDLYDVVAKEVAPKKAKLEIAERELAATMLLLNEKRAEVNSLEEQLNELLEKLQEMQEKKQRLEEDVTLCSNKLKRAEKLIAGLGGEKTRWQNAAEQLQKTYDAIAGDILVSCGYIAYLAPFTLKYRQEKIAEWYEKCKELGVPCSEDFTFAKTLGSEIKTQSWQIFGLPSDQFSTDNAIILTNSNKWPLLIDPQGQANKWIKAMEKVNNLEVIKVSDSKYMNLMIDCITHGKPLLLENIMETLDTGLNPILKKNIFKQHNRYYISLRDDVIEYNLNFKLYMTSSLRNPHYAPEICNKVKLINFALTKPGLEDQLLGIVVAKERPDLQAKRQELIVKNAKNRQALSEVEELILKTLSTSQGNILEDETAIETLDSSKLLSQAIISEQGTAKETEFVIESFRSSYRPIASHSAVLYYCIADFVNVDPMYQYSLTWFINLFVLSIDSANKSKILAKRLQFLRDTFTYDLYVNVCRSLFEKDKLLFSFILCSNILIAEEKMDKAELSFFLTGGAGVSVNEINPFPNWLKTKSWEELVRVSKLPAFEGLFEHFEKFSKEWKAFYDLKVPMLEDLPKVWYNKLTLFQSLILVRVLRMDKVLPNIAWFVKYQMGEKFVKPPQFDLVKSYNDSNCLSPLVFILSPGSDPMSALTSFAEKMGYANKFSSVSLGQGQGPLAARLIAEAQAEGNWVCLQNCHLAASWMPQLEKIWDRMDLVNTSLNFRLWLTSYPSNDFPPRLLQNSVKMTNEAPKGLQPNIIRSLTSYPVNDPGFFDSCPGKNNIFGKLLYGMVFFHAVIQERKKYGPIGWNISYGFDESDFQISVKQLQNLVNDYKETPYEAIQYLTGECNYGGRVTDAWDRRTLTTILQDFINREVIRNPNYMFTPGKEFGLPRLTGYQDYLQHVYKLPAEPSPEVFGLHSNAGITQGLQGTRTLLDSVLLIQGSSIQSSDSEGILLETCRNISKSLPEQFDIEAANLKYPISYAESMNALLIQEMERFNILLDVMKTSLRDIEKAVQGFVVMTPELENVAVNLQSWQIPPLWRKYSYPTLKPLGSYIADFQERVKFFWEWFEKGKPSLFWVSGFYSTHGFLTGVMQNYARKNTIPIDQLTFDFAVLKETKPRVFPKDGAYIFGLFVDGARWDVGLGRLEELLPTVLFDSLPIVWIKPILKVDLQVNARYLSPLYKTVERRGTLSTTGISTNFVLPVLLETEMNPRHWVKRGVALLCQLDD